MKIKHTPGPWRIEFVLSDDDKKHARVWPENEVAKTFFDAERLTPEIIAAAPEMLEALQVAVKFFYDNYPDGEVSWLPSLENAIRKAKGEEHSDKFCPQNGDDS
jgi:hypothetical protein